MIHIDNGCEFIRLIIDKGERELFFSQNSEYVGTSELEKIISKNYGKKIGFTKMFDSMLKLMDKFLGIVNKIFGNLVCHKSY